MLVRGFTAESFGDGGSAFTKNCRPSSFRTLAICAFAPLAKNDAKRIAQEASVVLISPAVFAVRLIISTVTPLRGFCLGEGDNNLGTYYTADSFQHWRFTVNVPSVLGLPPERSTQKRQVAPRWLVLLLRVSGKGCQSPGGRTRNCLP